MIIHHPVLFWLNWVLLIIVAGLLALEPRPAIGQTNFLLDDQGGKLCDSDACTSFLLAQGPVTPPVTRCMMTVPICPLHPEVAPPQRLQPFQDDWESASSNQARCMQRAPDYMSWCAGTQPITSEYFSDTTLVQANTVQPPPPVPQVPVANLGTLNLVSAEHTTDILILQSAHTPISGTTIDLNKMPSRRLNIRADALCLPPPTDGTQQQCSAISQVQFTLNNVAQSTENVAPYVMTGDTFVDGVFKSYNSWTPEPGAYAVVAKPFHNGVQGPQMVAAFTVIDSAVPEPVIPQVIIVGPDNGAVVKGQGNVTIKAEGSHAGSIVISVNNKPLATCQPVSVWCETKWPLKGVPNGQYVISAKLTIPMGASATDAIMVSRR